MNETSRQAEDADALPLGAYYKPLVLAGAVLGAAAFFFVVPFHRITFLIALSSGSFPFLTVVYLLGAAIYGANWFSRSREVGHSREDSLVAAFGLIGLGWLCLTVLHLTIFHHSDLGSFLSNGWVSEVDWLNYETVGDALERCRDAPVIPGEWSPRDCMARILGTPSFKLD